jgi:hypothetical protein
MKFEQPKNKGTEKKQLEYKPRLQERKPPSRKIAPQRPQPRRKR